MNKLQTWGSSPPPLPPGVDVLGVTSIGEELGVGGVTSIGEELGVEVLGRVTSADPLEALSTGVLIELPSTSVDGNGWLPVDTSDVEVDGTSLITLEVTSADITSSAVSLTVAVAAFSVDVVTSLVHTTSWVVSGEVYKLNV